MSFFGWDSAKIEACARACHEVNRAWCLANGDTSQLPWDEAPDWLRDSVIEGVQRALDGAGPEQLHESWCKRKYAEGWVCGPAKDPEKKTHPNLVPYDQLPLAQRAKDYLFGRVVKAWDTAVGTTCIITSVAMPVCKPDL